MDTLHEPTITLFTDLYFTLNTDSLISSLSKSLATLCNFTETLNVNLALDDIFDCASASLLKSVYDNPADTASTIIVKLNCRPQKVLMLVATVPQGTAESISFYFCDMTDQYRLQRENEKIHRLIDATGFMSNIGYWEYNLHSKKVHWSETMFRIYGLDTSFVPTMDAVLERYHPEDKEHVVSSLALSVERKDDITTEFRIVREDGQYRHIIAHCLIDRINDDGGVRNIFGIFQDITEQISIQSEKDLLTSAVRSTTAGIIVTNDQLSVLWVNQAFENLSGYGLEEVRGKRLGQFLHGPETDASTVEVIKSSLREHQPIETQILNYHKNGTPYWNHLIINPVITANGHINFVGVQHDITQHVHDQDTLKQLNLELEAKVISRTQLLINQNKRLEKLALRDPLSGINNRRAMYEDFEALCLHNKRKADHQVCFCLIDIDHFKYINDSYGHLAGDHILKTLPAMLTQLLRSEDSIYRVGGEEFVIIFENLSISTAKETMARLLSQVRNTVFNYDEQAITLTFSAGLIRLDLHKTIEENFKSADALLYNAKGSGRNTIMSQ